MREKSTDLEFQTMFHITYIMITSILGMLLVIVTALFQWDYWQIVCLMLGIGIISCWMIHFFQAGTAGMRVGFYTVFVLVGLLYYGGHETSLTDVPILICLFTIILSVQQDMKFIYLMASSYLVVLLWHIFGTGYIHLGMDELVFSRMILGTVCTLCAIFIARFFIRQQKRERLLRCKVEGELMDAKRENERFLVNVSHELRTPINAVNGMSEIILHRELDDGLRAEVESIQNAGRRLYGQVSDILDYSELITDTLVVSAEDYEPLSVINDAIMGLQWQRMNQKLDVAIDIQPDIPKLLHGDAGKLKKIILALMDNVIKFTESGGAYLYIGTREEEYGINLNIDVWDTGIGMSEEQLQQIFTHFYKGDSDIERKTGGLGLGLAIVHGMVTAMGGFISIKSKVSEGTHVHVVIPQQVVDRKASISVEKSREFQIVCYFNTEKYVRSEVADYYASMIGHIKNAFDFNISRADSLDSLKKMVAENPVTHVFVANWEYGMDRKYFEDLSKKVYTVVFADDSFTLPENSNVHVLRKPVYLLSVINLLNMTMPGTFKDGRNAEQEEKLHFDGVRALVVDDDSMNLVVADGILKTYGIEADTCLSGEHAIEKCVITDYQIIFMDYMMPGMNGVVAMQKIRELRNGHYKHIPIVVLTANAVSGAREMFLGEGFDEFISKPIEITAMSRVLRKMLTGGENG
ncbi:MAG: ATP-binding protein [Lachnospiraceae bacterium]